MIVVDASVLSTLLAYIDHRGDRVRAALGRDEEWTAPEHWKAEVFSAMRGLALGGKIAVDDARWAVDVIPRLNVISVPLDHLLPRMWQLRSAASGYDAAYVALAEDCDLTLVTSDAWLARTASRYCRVELVA